MATFVSCNDDSFVQIKRRLELAMSFIQHYRWIIEAYVSDFYTHDHWNKLPHCVKEYIDATDPPDWAWLLEDSSEEQSFPSDTNPAPLILLSLKAYSSYLSLRRTAVDIDSAETNSNIIQSLTTNNLKHCSRIPPSQFKDECSHNVSVSAFQPPNYKNGQCMDMQHIFRKHVKPKKQHEIQKLGQVINLLSEVTKCKSVIDVGAGLGHLSRLLTFRFGLKVITIEADGGHAPKASDFDRELKKDVLKKHNKILKSDLTDYESTRLSDEKISKLNPNTSSSDDGEIHLCKKISEKSKEDAAEVAPKLFCPEEELPSHVVCRISHDIASSQLLEVVRLNNSHYVSGSGRDNFILTGLHACGDLSPSLLRIFLECQAAVGLASVACCYMKMEQPTKDHCDTAKEDLGSYPMSNALTNISSHELTFESREMACHFADAYCQRLKDNPPHLKIHSYRAALQYLVTSVQPTFQSGQVRLVTKRGAQSSFLQ